MKEYRVQIYDGERWIFEAPYYVMFARRESAEDRISKELKRWELQKTLAHPMFSQDDIVRFSKPENWRVVEREVSQWKPVD